MGLMELAFKMIICLVIAGIIGWIVGFLLGRIFGSANATELVTQSEAKMRVREQELIGLRSDLTSASTKIGTLQTELSSLAATIKTREGWIYEMEAKQQELQADIEARVSELDELKMESEQEIKSLQAQLVQAQATARTEIEALQSRVAAAEGGASWGHQAVTELAPPDQPEDEARKIPLSIQQTAAEQLKEREAQITALKVRITELEMMMREVKDPSVKISPAATLPPGPKERDDLKKVFGIGPVLEQLLNKNGVYWFRQIAEWEPEDVRHYDNLLENFHGRIERERWIESARQEHQKKYGEDL